MRNNKKSNGVSSVWYDKTAGKWRGSVLIRYDESTEHQLRKVLTADTKQELLVSMERFRRTVAPVFVY